MEAEARERINAIKTNVRQSIVDPQGMAGVHPSENPNVESTLDALAGLCGGDDTEYHVSSCKLSIFYNARFCQCSKFDAAERFSQNSAIPLTIHEVFFKPVWFSIQN
jgi:hypothetical protein